MAIQEVTSEPGSSNSLITIATQIIMENSSFLAAETNFSYSEFPVSNFTNQPIKAAMNLAVNWLSILAMVEAMLSLGCSIDLESLNKHLKQPVNVIITALCQFVLLPLIVFGLVKLTKLSQIPMITLLVTTSSPGGILSNTLTYLAKGDVNLSVSMTTSSSVLALVFLPFNLFLFGSHWFLSNATDRHIISFQSILLFLVLMLIPAAVGVLIKWKFSVVANKAAIVCRILLLVTILAIAVLTAVVYELTLLLYMPKELWILSSFLPLVGFSLSYSLSTLAQQNDCNRRTVALETMCQNGQLSFAILKVTFSDNKIGSFAAFPLLYSLFELLEGMIFIAIVRCRSQPKEEEEDERSNLRTDFGKWRKNPVGTMRRVSLYVIDNVRRSLSRSSKHDERDRSGDVSDASETKTDDVFIGSDSYDNINKPTNKKKTNEDDTLMTSDKIIDSNFIKNLEEIELDEINPTPIRSDH